MVQPASPSFCIKYGRSERRDSWIIRQSKALQTETRRAFALVMISLPFWRSADSSDSGAGFNDWDYGVFCDEID